MVQGSTPASIGQDPWSSHAKGDGLCKPLQGIFYAVFVVVSPDSSHTCNIQTMEQEQCKLTGETSSDSQGKIKMEFREPGPTKGDRVQADP
jgi:hypothetical protein